MASDESLIMKWAFDHSSNGKLITDLNGVITAVNDAFLSMFGYSREEVLGNRTNLLRSKYSTPEFYQEMWRSLNDRNEWKGEIVNRTKSGDEKICFLTITSIRSPDGEKLGYLGVEIDLTERKMLEQQVAQGEKLASIGESLATLMHEIRNPLNGIAMNLYMLQQVADSSGHWSEGERESLQLITKEVKRLEGLVKNAMTYARGLEIHEERVLLKELFAEIYELTVHYAAEHGVTLTVAPMLETLSGMFDQNLIKQVLLNLVQNAIEAASASKERVVRISAEVQEHAIWQTVSASGKVLVIGVENSGEPISGEIERNLFKPFFTTKGQGLGLGLATCAKIIRQHHGVIRHARIEREPMTTIFTIALPM